MKDVYATNPKKILVTPGIANTTLLQNSKWTTIAIHSLQLDRRNYKNSGFHRSLERLSMESDSH